MVSYGKRYHKQMVGILYQIAVGLSHIAETPQKY